MPVRCEAAGCETTPSYGPPGGRRRWCAAHKEAGSVDLARKRGATSPPRGAPPLKRQKVDSGSGSGSGTETETDEEPEFLDGAFDDGPPRASAMSIAFLLNPA